MALVVFRSKAAGEIFMFPDTAHRIFEILGREGAPRGVITAEQVADARVRLQAAVDQEKAALKVAQQSGGSADEDEPGVAARAVTLGQRAYPLLEMLRAAEQRKVDVTWGV